MVSNVVDSGRVSIKRKNYKSIKRDVSIKLKLIVTATIIFSFTIVIGVNSIKNIMLSENAFNKVKAVNENLRELYEIQYITNQFNNNVGDLVDENKVSSKAYYKNRYSVLLEQLNGYLNEMEVDSSKAYEEYIKTTRGYIALSDKVLKLVEEGEYKDGYILFRNDFSVSKIKVDDLNTDLIKYHNDVLSKEDRAMKKTNDTLLKKEVVIIIISLIIGYVLITIVILSIKRQLILISNYTKALGGGDLSYKITTYKKDEIGEVIEQLNVATNNIKQVLYSVKATIKVVETTGGNTSILSKAMTKMIDKSKNKTSFISSSMQELIANVEEVNRSTDKILSTVSIIREKLKKEAEGAKILEEKANLVKDSASVSADKAFQVFERKSNNINESLEKGQVVSEISNTVMVISNIANQINLLSLNAAIESARAGEHGRGFSVVANEIKKLSEETEVAVNEISELVDRVTEALVSLSINSEDLMKYLNKDVKKDYELLIDIARRYKEDMSSLAEMAINTSNTTDEIVESINKVGIAMDNINEATIDISENTLSVNEDMEEIVKEIKVVEVAIDEEADLVKVLSENISKFIIESK